MPPPETATEGWIIFSGEHNEEAMRPHATLFMVLSYLYSIASTLIIASTNCYSVLTLSNSSPPAKVSTTKVVGILATVDLKAITSSYSYYSEN